VAVLLSGSGSNLAALLEGLRQTGSGARCAVVVSNKPDAYGLVRAAQANVPTALIDHRGKSRAAMEAELVALLQAFEVDWVLLAGFMRVLGPTFLDAFPGRVVNIHPSLLPAFPGLHAQRQAWAAGVRVSGATVHFVDAGMDTGPIIAQGVVALRPGDSEEQVQQRILVMEHRVYPLVLRLIAEGRLALVDGRVEARLAQGESLCLWGEGPSGGSAPPSA
jgi:phosphoribosylglycinamide formyltransferase-1